MQPTKEIVHEYVNTSIVCIIGASMMTRVPLSEIRLWSYLSDK